MEKHMQAEDIEKLIYKENIGYMQKNIYKKGHICEKKYL